MNILITGATGFIGSYLVKYLGVHNYTIQPISRIELINITAHSLKDSSVIIHLAGKAHDLGVVSKPSEYYHVNYELTKQIYDAFQLSQATKFIFISSVKAVADSANELLKEDCVIEPNTHYGKSKRMAEEYILGEEHRCGKKFFILRPCMVHGPGNKGNLNLLYKVVTKRIPWPLGAFKNARSFCNIDNLCFIIKELVERNDIPSGIYNIADNESISTNELIKLIAASQNKNPIIFCFPKNCIKRIARIGDVLKLPLTSFRLQKLTESFIVSNDKIKKAINKPLPVSVRDGLMKTFQSFKNDD
jgi:nucleoside-diphosphate-sugar epimerase